MTKTHLETHVKRHEKYLQKNMGFFEMKMLRKKQIEWAYTYNL